VDRIIVADRSVPVGAYTVEMLGKATKVQGSLWLGGVNRRIVSREHDVRAVLAKVSLGEADAGIVYTTDGLAGGAKVRMIPIPEAVNIEASYPAVRFANSPNADLAKDFMRFLFERDAQKTLVNHGFSSPIIPGSSIQVSFFGKHTLLSSRKIHLLRLKTFSASEHGVMKSFHGYDLLPSIESARHGRPGRSVKLTAGDGYSQTLSLSEVSADGIFLVESAHDNFQVIIPSQPPRFWVHWIREIVVQ
jgi:molybdate transport system substrate-binding protein